MAISEFEKNLIKKAIKGDEISFETLVSSCKGKAFNIALRYLKNQHDAMDALQESLIKIYKNFDKFKMESSFDTWVYRIVVNTCKDIITKEMKRPPIEEYANNNGPDDHLEIQDFSNIPENIVVEKEETRLILKCLNKLIIDQKEILILRDIQGFSYEEISKILDCNIGTVKSRISRARSSLREIYIKESMRNR